MQNQACPVCGGKHDNVFTQIVLADYAPIFLRGGLPPIVKLLHKANTKKAFQRWAAKMTHCMQHAAAMSVPTKPFYSLKQRDAYKLLFETRRGGPAPLSVEVSQRRERMLLPNEPILTLSRLEYSQVQRLAEMNPFEHVS
jgi:hypothetical protein